MSRYVNIDKVLKCLRLNHKDVIYIDKNECAKRIKALPTIEPKRGEWVLERLDNYKLYKVTCSCCGWWGCENYDSYVDISDFAYCPNCGAKMDGEREGE